MTVTLYIDGGRHTREHVRLLKRELSNDPLLRGRIRFGEMRNHTARMDWRIVGAWSEAERNQILYYCQAIRDKVDKWMNYANYKQALDDAVRMRKFAEGRTI